MTRRTLLRLPFLAPLAKRLGWSAPKPLSGIEGTATFEEYYAGMIRLQQQFTGIHPLIYGIEVPQVETATAAVKAESE